ncbi:Energy-coupling factor transporter transmembrane protein EcfT [Pelotomaculum sp. FP]|uniref:energy-coupling factor transporter transmembrane component T n=1 Tax=Pelotomaculum sp. FP TaxID=261474 RepID=UPI001064E03A|nr:energy-coupling factor transporter transmembrane component T [Pelotomaculum sp. FP]TEB16749.1 Energy-coupling factor transporter transmembrane protein EcfT [Pelotomaculum sp. FP]
MKDAFSTLHPVVTFTYFTAVLLFSMCFLHPVCLAVSLLCSFCYSVLLRGQKAIRFNLLYLLPLLLFMAVINPAFNHAGVTILFYLKNGNPVTLESILYGIAAAGMFGAVILWFSCYNAVMTSDKFIYLFGRLIPALSLVLSMALRFVPRYKAQIQVISIAQQGIGRDVSNGNILERARNGLQILSMMTTWALENAIETADSMKSRGYGLPGRTSFSIFRFDRRDKTVFGAMLLLMATILAGAAAGYNTMRFFPSLRLPPPNAFSIGVYCAYLALGLLPVIIDTAEELKWKRIKSEL